MTVTAAVDYNVRREREDKSTQCLNESCLLQKLHHKGKRRQKEEKPVCERECCSTDVSSERRAASAKMETTSSSSSPDDETESQIQDVIFSATSLSPFSLSVCS